MQFLVYKRQIWNFFTFRRYHRILHTCQELNKKEKKPYIYSTFLGTTSSYGCICKLKQNNTMNIRIYRHFFRYINKSIFVSPPPSKKKILQRIPVLYYENIVEETDVNVSIYVIKHACIWKPRPFQYLYKTCTGMLQILCTPTLIFLNTMISWAWEIIFIIFI